MVNQWNNHNIHTIYQSSVILYGHNLWYPKIIILVKERSLIRDDQNKNNNKENLKYYENLQNVTQRH
jgi:hypothetical protein